MKKDMDDIIIRYDAGMRVTRWAAKNPKDMEIIIGIKDSEPDELWQICEMLFDAKLYELGNAMLLRWYYFSFNKSDSDSTY